MHRFFAQPLGLHTRAGELVAQALGDGLGFIGLGVRRGQPGHPKQGADEYWQGVNNRLQHEDLLFKNRVQLSKLNAQSGQASGVRAMITAAPTRQKRPTPVRVHCAAISSFVVWAVEGGEGMESPAGKEKARERVAAGLKKEPVTFRVMPGEH